MPPFKGYNYICNIVDCYSRFAFGGHLKQKTAKEVSELLLKFTFIFGKPRILQMDNGKEFNNADLCAMMDKFKTRKINGRPYHPQPITRDWPSLLGEFYYKYNNQVNKSTKPMTPHQRFFKRPHFSMALEEQRKKNFWRLLAHLDVEEDDDDNNLTLNENLKSVKINGITDAEPGIVTQINSKSVHKKAQEIARVDAENDYKEFVESLCNTRITNMINESEWYDK
ncbi:unnamed protein product [Mytilus coruscus]|uniref:Integrase catalytic domain-containing protein n=1 Tax=Mytilus coruscus TaxID=42192 RepID=A0A6J8E4S0_MYTCO|nr:unnamed protein product [Mytilus coruscus]